MSTGFIPREYSLSPIDLIPPDEDDEPDQQEWREYCQEAAKIDRYDVLLCVLTDLDSEMSPLFEFIDDAIQNPHEPGRPKESITKLARLGQSLLNLIARSVDDQVNLRMAVKE